MMELKPNNSLETELRDEIDALREELRIGNHLNAVQTDKINDLEAELCQSRRETATEAAVGNERVRIWKEKLIGARARIAELEAAARWIPVGERLPETACRVIVVTDLDPLNPVERLFHPGSYPFGFMFAQVTHWRPLPEPPEA